MPAGRLVVIRAAVLGAAAGLAWGFAAPIWMRMIAEEPAFSWSGTALILTIGVLVGLCAGVVHG